jgi:hypothetical protein
MSQDEPRPAPAPSAAATTVMPIAAAAEAREGYTCPTPWSGELADVVVICCSSEKYERQNQEFVAALGYRMPHFIQVPGGPAVLYGLAAIKGYLAKALGLFVEKAVDLLDSKDVICIAHEGCGAYKSSRVSVLGDLTRRLSGKDMKDVQLEHLRKSCRELQAQLGRGVEVVAFYASIIEGGQKRIRYEPVDFESRIRTRTG